MATTSASSGQLVVTARAGVTQRKANVCVKAPAAKIHNVSNVTRQFVSRRSCAGRGATTGAERLPAFQPRAALLNTGAGVPSQSRGGSGSFDLSSGLLEKCFSVALQTRLTSWQFIDAKVDCSTFGLLGGTLNGFMVRGLGWLTPQGMSVRLFEVALGETKVDLGQALATQQIVFASVPKGMARLVFNREDFGNLFRHPMLLKQAKHAVQGKRFSFDPLSVHIDSAEGPQGCISFSGTWEGDGQVYAIRVQPDVNGKVRVNAALKQEQGSVAFAAGDGAGSAPIVAHELMSFFNNLSLDLDGPLMTFRSMMVRRGRDSEVIDMKLNLKLMRMPPLDISF